MLDLFWLPIVRSHSVESRLGAFVSKMTRPEGERSYYGNICR